jgi:hypothetical protein
LFGLLCSLLDFEKLTGGGEITEVLSEITSIPTALVTETSVECNARLAVACKTNAAPTVVSAATTNNFRLHETGIREFGSNHAVATIFDVIAAARTLVQNDTKSALTILETLTHFIDLMKVASEEFGDGSFRNMDIVQRNPLSSFELFFAATFVGLAHDASFIGASGASEDALTDIVNTLLTLPETTSVRAELCAPEPYSLVSVMVSSF